MSLAFYRPVGGFFEQAHPVVKLIAMAISFVPPFFGQTPLQVLPYLLLLFFAALGAGAWPNLLRVKGLAIALFVMSAVLWSVFYPGQTVLYKVGPLNLYSESVIFGAAMGLRINCFMFAAIIFFTATKIEDFTYGLSRLGFPYVMSFALSLAFRLTPLFIQTGQDIVIAQKARGLNLDQGGLIKKIRQYVPIIVPVLVNGLRKSDHLAIALESKGFGRGGKRTALSQFPVTWRDFVLLFVLLAICGVMAVGRYGHFALLPHWVR